MAELVKFLISAFDLVEGRRIGLEAFGDALSAKCLVFTLRFAVRFEKVITGLVRRGCGARALAEGISGLHGAFVGDDCLVVTTHAAETERLVVAINSALFFEDVRAGHPWGGVGPCVTELVDVGDCAVPDIPEETLWRHDGPSSGPDGVHDARPRANASGEHGKSC